MKKIIPTITASGDWFYMNQKEISVREIYEILKADNKLDVEIWEAAGVLEINYTEKQSIDFEMIQPMFKDKEGNEYLKKNDIHALYMVSFQDTDFELVVPILKYIVMNCGGYFCEDNMDLSQSMIIK